MEEKEWFLRAYGAGAAGAYTGALYGAGAGAYGAGAGAYGAGAVFEHKINSLDSIQKKIVKISLKFADKKSQFSYKMHCERIKFWKKKLKLPA